MIEPVSGTGLVLFGAGAWLADKLFGPSADALGKELQVYGSKRLTDIFGQAAMKLSQDEVNSLPPGFVLQFMQKASYSQDDELLTEAWANLLANSSREFENRYSLFVDILASMTNSEAQLLNILFAGKEMVDIKKASQSLEKFRTDIEARGSGAVSDVAEAMDHLDRLLAVEFPLPGKITLVGVPYNQDADGMHGIAFSDDALDSDADSLIRNRLVTKHSAHIGIVGQSPYFEAIVVTALGKEFLQACGDFR